MTVKIKFNSIEESNAFTIWFGEEGGWDAFKDSKFGEYATKGYPEIYYSDDNDGRNEIDIVSDNEDEL